MSVVLDASITLAWALADELTPAVGTVFANVQASGGWVPGLWRLEVANVLELNVRRGRHPAAIRDETLADLSQMPIRLDAETDRHAWGETLRLAQVHRLTSYDAAYLELAMRRRLPLATLDADLRKAASAEGVTVLG